MGAVRTGLQSVPTWLHESFGMFQARLFCSVYRVEAASLPERLLVDDILRGVIHDRGTGSCWTCNSIRVSTLTPPGTADILRCR